MGTDTLGRIINQKNFPPWWEPFEGS